MKTVEATPVNCPIPGLPEAKRKLYCLQLERLTPRGWFPWVRVYAHAYSAVQAVLGYRQTLTRHQARRIRVGACGEAIGVLMNDKKGLDLSVE